MVAPVAAAGAKKAADNPWPLIIGAGALVLLSKWGFEGVKDQINIVPETRQFIPAVLGGGRKGTWIPQEGLSPNPPTEEWWNEYAGDLRTGWSRKAKNLGPTPVQNPLGVPTAPVVRQRPPSQADIAGQQTHEWFTKPALYPWFYLADLL